MAASYLGNYHALVDDIISAGNDREKIMMALGLTGDIWPVEIRADALDDGANARRLDWKRGLRT